MRKAWKVTAAVYGVIAVLAAIFFLSTSWLPTVDFDIVGFFWLFRNAPRIGAFVIAIMCAGMSAYAAYRAWAAG